MTTLRLYLRRSKADEGKQEFSLDVQRRGCLEYAPTLAQRLNLKFGKPVEYVDDGLAGDDFVGRTGLARLLAETQPGDVIIARDQSRIGRDALEVTLALRRLTQETCARVWYYGRDAEAKCGTATEQAVTYLEGFGGQHELESIRSRTKEAIRDRVKLGFSGGGACFGYRLERLVDPTDPHRKKGRTRLHVLPEEAAVVRRIFALYIGGRGFKAIAALLNEERVPAPKAGRRGSGSWAAGAVREVLLRDRYRGVYVHGRSIRVRKGRQRPAKRAPASEVIQKEVPEWRIIDDTTWFAVRTKMAERRPERKLSAPAAKYPLSRVGRCVCKGSIVARRTHHARKGYVPGYGCLSNWTRGKAVCAISLCQAREDVESALAGYLEQHVFTEAVRDDLIAQVRAELERRLAAPGDHVEGLEAELRRLEGEKARLIRLAATTDDDPDIAAEVNTRRQRIAQLQAQLAGARQAPRVLRDALDRATEHVRARFADLRALLADRGEGGRRLYQALFPEGLHFSPTQVGGRRVWRIEGAAVLDPNCDVTPPGIENTRNVTKPREDSQSPSEKPKAQIASRGLTRRSGSMAAKLAVMAANALRNYDVDRALELLEQIRVTCDPESCSAQVQTLKIVK